MTKSFMPLLVYDQPLTEVSVIRQEVGAIALVSGWRTSLALSFDYALMLVTLAAFHLHPSFWLWLPSALIVGSRQHALAVMMHEAAHGNLCRSRRLNDWLGQYLCASPLIIASLRHYRARHRLHHTKLNSVQDPDWYLKATDSEWRYPTSNIDLLLRLARVAAGGGVAYLVRAQLLTKSKRKSGVHFSAGMVTYLSLACVLITSLHAWATIALLWLVPLVTIMPLCERVRSVAEHFGLKHTCDLNATRSVRASWFSLFFFAPHHVN